MGDKIEDQPSAEHVNIEHNHEHGQEIVSDNEKVLDDTEATAHLRQLSPEELDIEKKLRKKIDLRIMPIIVLIYLMNYIDRYVWWLESWLGAAVASCMSSGSGENQDRQADHVHSRKETTMPLPVCKAWRQTST